MKRVSSLSPARRLGACLIGALAIGMVATACGRIGFRAEADSTGDGGLDAGDAGSTSDQDAGCTPTTETCNGRDDDCDTAIDEDFELASDVDNCGACGMVCPDGAANSRPICRGGMCSLVCDAGFEDCNDVAEDGCEADLLDASSCGACGEACGIATPLCVDGAGGAFCAAACTPGLTRCGSSCVDLASSTTHCGTCGMACPSPAHASPTCAEGRCGYRCDVGWGDCDGLSRTGCEVLFGTVAHCSRCGDACELPFAIPACADGACVVTACTANKVNCDGIDANGCEREGIPVYPDEDRDGYGSSAAEMLHVCEVTPGLSSSSDDCNDLNPLVNPGQMGFFSVPAGDAGFDYNCDGAETAAWRVMMLCIEGPVCMLGNEGWAASPPACGVSAVWVTDCTGSGTCTLMTELRTQRCR